MSVNFETRMMVQKRTGELVVFEFDRILNAAAKAYRARGKTISPLKESAFRAHFTDFLDKKYPDAELLHIEQIQDLVEETLMAIGDFEVARAYIKHRAKKAELRSISYDSLLDDIDIYLNRNAWEEKENSNVDFSAQGLREHIASKVFKSYWLNRVMVSTVRELHESGKIHIHDLNLPTVYCCGWDLKALLLEGFAGVPNSVASKPPKHFGAALSQIWNFLYTMQGEAAGAQSLSGFDVYLAPFIRHDKLTRKQVKQRLEQFLFNMNTRTRVGFQCPFTNLTFFKTIPSYMKDEPVIIGGKFLEETYGDYQEEVDLLNDVYCESMLEGDADGRQFHFPIPTYNVTKDFDWDNPRHNSLWKLTGKYGAPYFTNYINSKLNPEDVRSMCPMRYDTKVNINIDRKWWVMSLEDIYTTLQNKTNVRAYVWHRGASVDVVGVVRTNVERLLRVCTKRDPVGEVFEHRHIQPGRLHADAPEKNFYVHQLRTGMFIPYSDSGVAERWSEITKIEEVEKTMYDQYAYCITVDSDDHYFELGPDRLITHNCRLQLDFTHLKKAGGGLFGADSMTGSVGVGTINPVDIACAHPGDEEAFMDELIFRADTIADFLDDKRKFIEAKCSQGLYPFSRRWLKVMYDRSIASGISRPGYYCSYFSTLGIVGMNEACLNFMGKGIETEEGYAFAQRVLHKLDERLEYYRTKYETPFNLEATPAEGVSYRLAKLTQQMYPDAITAVTGMGNVEPFLTNSTQLPVNFSSDIYKVIKHQEGLQTIYSGGTVLHLFLCESLDKEQQVKNLIRQVCSQTKLPYITISPTYSVCKEHGYIRGRHTHCPHCGRETEIYERVVGFYTPISRWNKGKAQEELMRKQFDTESFLTACVDNSDIPSLEG